MLRVFAGLDRVMSRFNALAGGVVLSRSVEPVPVDEPVAWREVTRKALGRFHYLIRCILPVQIVVILLCLLFSTAIENTYSQIPALTFMLVILWALVTLVIVSQAANIVVSERVHQTLEVLMTTPLTGREIVQQKMKAVWRLAVVCAVPLLTVIATEAWLENNTFQSGDYAYLRHTRLNTYLFCSAASLLVYLPLMAWFAMFVGLKSKTRFRAIITALGIFGAWCVAPIFLTILISTLIRYGDFIEHLLLLSPAGIIGFNEAAEWSSLKSPPWVVLTMNFTVYGLLALLFRLLCLRNADRYLGRA